MLSGISTESFKPFWSAFFRIKERVFSINALRSVFSGIKGTGSVTQNLFSFFGLGLPSLFESQRTGTVIPEPSYPQEKAPLISPLK